MKRKVWTSWVGARLKPYIDLTPSRTTPLLATSFANPFLALREVQERLQEHIFGVSDQIPTSLRCAIGVRIKGGNTLTPPDPRERQPFVGDMVW